MRLPLRTFLLAAAGAAALAGRAHAQTAASQTVVVPSLPGVPNKEMRIGGEDLAGAAAVGPEVSFTGQVVQWEEGRSITMKLADGLTRVVPVASNIIFPPDLRPGGLLTVLVRQTADGRYKVTGLTTAVPPPSAPAVVPAAAATPPPAPAPPAALPEPLAAGPKGKAIVRASYLTLRGSLGSIDGGSVTIVEPGGKARTVKLAAKAVVDEGLTRGDAVVVRVPLQKPFDGKTADRVERPKPPKTPRPSKFRRAESPKD